MSVKHLSDEQFLVEVDALIGGRENSLVTQKPDETPPTTPEAPEAPVVAAVEETVTETPQPQGEAPVEQTPSSLDEPPKNEEAAVVPEGDSKAAAEGEAEGGEAVEEPDYKAIYERLFGQPIRAAGQDIKLNNPDEAISLIQKGVGFHHKMNKLHGELKYVEMLRNNGLLDEEQLSLLIDAKAGKAGAIKKLLDSAKIDPLSLDSTEASSYAPSDHRVSDEQVLFQTTVSDLSEFDSGKAVLADARNWDQTTKAEIFKNPALLSTLAQQKEMGRYDLIVANVERAKLLGQLPANEPFLSAYTRVGNQMLQAGAFGAVNSNTNSIPAPVAQKTVTPSPTPNKQKVAAAAPTRASAPVAQPKVDISQMDDETFVAHARKVLKI